MSDRLLSLWDIMETHFHPYAAIFADNLARLTKFLAGIATADGNDTLAQTDRDYVHHCAMELYRVTETVKLRQSNTFAARLSYLAINGVPVSEMRKAIDLVCEVTVGELYHRNFLPVLDSPTSLLQGPNEITPDMENKFGIAVLEIREAAKCLAFGVGTASVFHLMRACEIVLKSLFKSGGWHPPRLAESWGAMLGPLDEQLKKPPVAPVALWQANMPFLSALVFDLRAAKRGYRDSTMHVESNYSTDDAKGILSATITLVRHASEHLDQDGNFT